MIVEKSVGCLSPFQGDVRAVVLMEGEKTAVEPLALFFEYTYRHLYARIPQFLYATALHLGERVDTAHHDTAHPLADDQVGTRRSLAIMRTRFETDINGSFRQKMFVGRADGGEGVHLSVSLAAPDMIALADDPVMRHNDSPHHRVGAAGEQSIGSQLEAAAHVAFVKTHICHRMIGKFDAKIVFFRDKTDGRVMLSCG